MFKYSFESVFQNKGVLSVKNSKIMKMEFKYFFDFSSSKHKTIPVSKRRRGGAETTTRQGVNK